MTHLLTLGAFMFVLFTVLLFALVYFKEIHFIHHVAESFKTTTLKKIKHCFCLSVELSAGFTILWLIAELISRGIG